MNSEHVPAPLAHTPRITQDNTSDVYGLMLVETGFSEDAWVHCENPSEVER